MLDNHAAHDRLTIDNALIDDRPSHDYRTLNDNWALDNDRALDDLAANDWSFNHLSLNHHGSVACIVPIGVPVSCVG